VAKKRFNSGNLITLVTLAILVGTEIFGVALALGWALAGLFELGTIVAYAMMALFSIFGAYLLAKFMRAAARHEPLRG
jgi:hypothetical protein